MNCGRLSARNDASSGSGWPSIAPRAKSSAWRLERGQKRPHAGCGPRLHRSIVNVPSATPIIGRRMPPSCHRNGIVPSGKIVAKLIISSGSTIRCANAVVGWFAKRSRFRRRWPITLAPSGISSTTITHSNARNSPSLLLHDYP